MTGVRSKFGGLKLEPLEARDNPSGPAFSLSGFSLPRIQFVSGVVFADANGNGVQDAREGGVNGVRVYADANNNGVRDAGERSAVTATAFSSTSVNGTTTFRTVPGSYLFNAAVRGGPLTSPIRVELPADATLTTPVESTQPGLSRQTVNIGLQGVSGTPGTSVTTPGATGGVFVSSGSTSTSTPSSTTVTSGSSISSSASSLTGGSTGSSSSSVYAFSYVSPTGQAFANATGSVSGNGSAFGSATAVGSNGTVTSVFGG
jgi:hypothetical protein